LSGRSRVRVAVGAHPLTASVSPLACQNAGSEEAEMTQAPATFFKIPTESPVPHPARPTAGQGMLRPRPGSNGSMGQDIEAVRIGAEDRRVYGEKLRRSLRALDQMLGKNLFDVGPSRVGMEIELHLVDARAAPSMRNEQVLDAITEPAWEAELGRFNLEVNVPPGPLSGAGLAELERQGRAPPKAAPAQGPRA